MFVNVCMHTVALLVQRWRIKLFSLLLFVLILSAPLCEVFVQAMPSYLGCNDMYIGFTTGHGAIGSTTSYNLDVKRGTTSLSDGSTYIPGETLSVSLSSVPSQYAIEMDGGATFVSNGKCSGKRKDNSGGSITLPFAGSGAVTIKAVARIGSSVSMVPIVTLNELVSSPTSVPSSSAPTSSPSSSASTSFPSSSAPTSFPSSSAPTSFPSSSAPTSFPSSSAPTSFPLSSTPSISTTPTSKCMKDGTDQVHPELCSRNIYMHNPEIIVLPNDNSYNNICIPERNDNELKVDQVIFALDNSTYPPMQMIDITITTPEVHYDDRFRVVFNEMLKTSDTHNNILFSNNSKLEEENDDVMKKRVWRKQMLASFKFNGDPYSRTMSFMMEIPAKSSLLLYDDNHNVHQEDNDVRKSASTSQSAIHEMRIKLKERVYYVHNHNMNKTFIRQSCVKFPFPQSTVGWQIAD